VITLTYSAVNVACGNKYQLFEVLVHRQPWTFQYRKRNKSTCWSVLYLTALEGSILQ